MKYLPHLLIGLRILLTPLIILAASNYHYLFVIICFYIAILSDIFDGIIARHLSVSTASLRRADTWADRIFWLGALICIWISCPYFISEYSFQLMTLVSCELLSHIVSLLKFKKETSSHNLLSKLWGISIVPALSQMLVFCHSIWLFDSFIITGILARIDAMMIMLILPHWEYDVPSVWHAWQIRKGKTIKRRKILNS